MNNFGVIEIASTTTKSTPGWAYVPDTGPTLPAALQPTNRKRAARNQSALTLSDLSAREETRLRKDLEALDRDNHRDVNIPIPPKPSGGGSTRAQNKHTPNVRKILQSQKTFANHLDDYQAMLALAESNPAAAAAAAMGASQQTKPSTPTASKSASPAPTSSSSLAGGGGGSSRRSAAAAKRAAAREKLEEERKKAKSKTPGGRDPESSTTTTTTPQPQSTTAPGDGDTPMPDAPTTRPAGANNDGPPQSYPRESAILPPYNKPPPPAHPGDTDPLLVSYVPPFPSDDELRALMTAPPLSYLEARATIPTTAGDDSGAAGSGGYPARQFCGVCGYWGRVKCMKCGGRVCALDCLEAHREECVARYGL